MHLALALRMDSHYRELVDSEPDFDPIRSDPEFQALTDRLKQGGSSGYTHL